MRASPNMPSAKKMPLSLSMIMPSGTASTPAPSAAIAAAAYQGTSKFKIETAARYAPSPKNATWPNET